MNSDDFHEGEGLAARAVEHTTDIDAVFYNQAISIPQHLPKEPLLQNIFDGQHGDVIKLVGRADELTESLLNNLDQLGGSKPFLQ